MSSLKESLEVYVNPVGDVCIAQRDMNEDCYVVIPPEDVDELIRWLKEQQIEAWSLRSRFSDEIPFTD